MVIAKILNIGNISIILKNSCRKVSSQRVLLVHHFLRSLIINLVIAMRKLMHCLDLHRRWINRSSSHRIVPYYWLLMNYIHLMQLVSKRKNMCIMNISCGLLHQSCVLKSFIYKVTSGNFMSEWAYWSLNIIAQTGNRC